MLSASGCADVSFGEQMLLRPPRATGDKAEIQTVIKEQAGSDYMLKYPQQGEYRSAVTIFETGQKKNEYAVALYSTENNTKLNISVIAHESDGWKCLGSYNNTSTGVDRIIFEDLNNDGSDEILVGWTTYNAGQNSLTAYSIENNTVREMTIDETYTEIVVSDITQDKSEDIILLSLRNDQTPSSARLLQYSEQEKRLIGKFSISLDSGVTSFVNIQCGNLDKNTPCVIIDGSKNNGQLTTQVIYFDPKLKQLLNPLVSQNGDGTSVMNSTTRKNTVTARDINGDGIVEVPVVSQMPAPPDTDAGSLCSLTSWKQIDLSDGSLKTVINTVMNYTDGYYVIMPQNWSTNVTGITDAENRETNFYIWDGENSSVGEELLSICRFTNSEWDKADKKKYVMLADVELNGTEVIIAGQIFKTKNKDLNLSVSDVRTSVCLIAE